MMPPIRNALPAHDRAIPSPPPAALDKKTARVLEALKRRPMTAGEITGYVLTKDRADERDAILSDLVGRGLAYTTTSKDDRHGARFTFYHAAESAR